MTEQGAIFEGPAVAPTPVGVDRLEVRSWRSRGVGATATRAFCSRKLSLLQKSGSGQQDLMTRIGIMRAGRPHHNGTRLFVARASCLRKDHKPRNSQTVVFARGSVFTVDRLTGKEVFPVGDIVARQLGLEGGSSRRHLFPSSLPLGETPDLCAARPSAIGETTVIGDH